MRILIQGIGSIGQRHYRNARALGHEVAFLRHTDATRPFVSEFLAREEVEGRKPLLFYDLVSARTTFAPDGIVIAHPNHLHADAAIAAAQAGLPILVEKPLAATREDARAVISAVQTADIPALVGYNMRFHPLLAKMKNMVAGGNLGQVYSAMAEVGENIEDWHPWEDYRDTYAPYVKSGGGSLLCFSHDIDALYWVLGAPDWVRASGGKITSLCGDAEDLVQSLWGYESGMTATLHIDYWQRPKCRTVKIVGEKMTLMWDAYGELVSYDHADGSRRNETLPEGFERNDMFLEEMRHFIACIEGRVSPLIPLAEGADVVGIVEDMKSQLLRV